MPRVRSATSVSLAVLGCGPVAAFAGLTQTCFKNTDVQHRLPLAPSSYPEELQGILWMDQAGFYGQSGTWLNRMFGRPDFGATGHDLAMSWGDTEYSKWDPKTRSINVDVNGPAWEYQNNRNGDASWQPGANFKYDGGLGWAYTFTGNEDLSNFKLNSTIPGFAYSMAKITPQPDVVCPPPPGTSKYDTVKCATFDRISTALWGLIETHYYDWRIVDGQGNPIQPYYDEYIKFSNSVSDKSGPCSAPNTAFHGVRSGASKFSAGNSSIVHASAFVA